MTSQKTETVDLFLFSISDLLRQKDAAQLENYLLVEPPMPPIYATLKSELQEAFPGPEDDALQAKCSALLPSASASSSSWLAFVAFMQEYLKYLRDFDMEDLDELYQLLTNVTSKGLTRLTLTLEHGKGWSLGFKKPDRLQDAAEVIQRAFIHCLTDRLASRMDQDAQGRPVGKAMGVYVLANLILRLFARGLSFEPAVQLFTNIMQMSPPLARYPASQRVEYLYHLGRFAFRNGHWYQAVLSLDAAYRQCHRECLKQRRLILTYLWSANFILGRMPSKQMLETEPVRELWAYFRPLARAVMDGNLRYFETILPITMHPFFEKHRVWMPFRQHIIPQVWQQMARLTFLVKRSHPDADGDGDSKRAPSISLLDFLALARGPTYAAREALGDPEEALMPDGRQFAAARKLAESWRISHSDPDFDGSPDGGLIIDESLTIDEVECFFVSLINQGFLNGYVSHPLLRFVILGAKGGVDPLVSGFPRMWSVVEAQSRAEYGGQDLVPGWVREEAPGANQGGKQGLVVGPGRVINLSGARPAGAPPLE
ncbi:MAG: hypothetical protein M1826_007598 [Phylliscum demangeonii]|nr:MAG: hypothetical protein M1826_007598 [Phylliscum demangeonii]